jgi:uncharacterized delta-60 repeat protein
MSPLKRVATTTLPLLVIWAACDTSRQTAPESSLPPVAAVVPAVCGQALTVPLIADEVVPIGTVRIGNDESTLFVTYQVMAQHPLQQTRLAVDPTLDGIPTNESGNPILGRFPHSTRHRPSVTEFTYAIPLADIPAAPDDDLVVAAFAESGSSGAWGEGPRFTEDGPWAMYTPYTMQSCVAGPTAIISVPADPAAAQAGTPVAFDGSTSQDPAAGGLIHNWDFADGSLGGSAQIAHVFAAGGTFVVTLTVTDVNGASDTEQVTVNVAAPPSPVGTATVFGTVVDAAELPLAGVDVRLDGTSLGTTDADGMLQIDNFPTGVPVLLELMRAGYSATFVNFELSADATHGFFEATMRTRNAAQVLADAAAGGTLVGEDGVSISLPPNALVNGAGNPVAGAVNIAMTPIDVSGSELGAFPGRFVGILPDGSSSLIVSFGAAEFVISQNGEELQLAPGARATLQLPVYMPGAPIGDDVEVWSLDEATGVWIQEGMGTVVAGAGAFPVLEAEVGHLSTWNVDRTAEAVLATVGCELEATILEGKCHAEIESMGGDWSFATRGETGAVGTVFQLAPGTLYRLRAFAFDDACILRGETVLTDPVTNFQEIRILLECLTGDDAVRLEYGDQLDADISVPGELDVYVFAGTDGDEIRVDLHADRGTLYSIRDPDGAVIADGTVPTGGERQVFRTLTTTGDHTIDINGESATDTYAYTIGLDVHVPDAVMPLTLPASAGGDLGFPTEVDVFTFDGTTGDEISVAAVRSDGSLNADVSVFSPTNILIMQDHFTNAVAARALRLAETGTYRVEIAGGSSLPGSYLLDVRAAPATQLQDADDLLRTLTSNLQVDAFTFTGPAGDMVRLDFVRTAPGNVLRGRVHNAAGTLVGDRPFDDDPDQHIFVTLDGDDYRTSVFSNLDLVGGEYRIGYSVFAPEPDKAIAYGDEFTEEIGFPIETDVWLFSADAGDEIQLNVSTAAGSTLAGDVRLISPASVLVLQGSYTQALEFGTTQTLTETGQYRIEVTGTSGVPGDYVIALQQQGGPGVLPFGELVAGTMDAIGEVDEYTFDADAGDLVRIHGATARLSTLRATVELEDPSGGTVLAATVFESTQSVNTAVQLPATGTYTLVVTAIQNTPGDYQIGIGTGIGRRDLTFGGSGLVSTGSATSDGFNIRRLRVVDGDAVLGVGSEKIRRWLADGTLDAAFGTNGVVDMNAAVPNVFISAVGVQPDGRIVVAGQVNDDWVVLRYTAAGVLDATFDGDGILLIETAVFSSDLISGPKDIRFLADGTDLDIIIGGKVRAGTGDYPLTIARLNPDGSFDAAFNGGALLKASHPGVGEAMELQSTGRIVLIGHSSSNVIAVGYNPDGTLDTNFGVGGTATIAVGQSLFAREMMLRPGDRFVVLGEITSLNALAVGFTADGAADATFGTNGIVAVDFGHLERFWEGEVDGSGRLVLSGVMRLQSMSGEGDAFVVRLLADGTPDATFGIGGVAVEDLPDDPRGLALDSQGRILVGGDRPSGSFAVGNLIRLLTN